MQFRVVILDVLPSEIGKGHDGFEKMSSLLADEASRGWKLKQVDSSWAQGYMIYTIILEKPEAQDEPPPVETKSADGPVNSSFTAAAEPKVSPEFEKENVTYTPTRGANGLSWLASGVGVGVGIFLILLGLITTITISNAIALGRTSPNGFIFPEAAFAVGIVVLVFSAYKIGDLARRQNY